MSEVKRKIGRNHFDHWRKKIIKFKIVRSFIHSFHLIYFIRAMSCLLCVLLIFLWPLLLRSPLLPLLLRSRFMRYCACRFRWLRLLLLLLLLLLLFDMDTTFRSYWSVDAWYWKWSAGVNGALSFKSLRLFIFTFTFIWFKLRRRCDRWP